MKYLVVYRSHHGTTRKVATLLKEQLGATLVDLHESQAPVLDGFDVVIIGGSIHAGHIQSEIRDFCEKNKVPLLHKKLGLFLCFMDKEHGKKEFEEAYPEVLRKHAQAKGLFGGEFVFEEMNFIERMIVRKVSGVKDSISELDKEAIDAFVNLMHA